MRESGGELGQRGCIRKKNIDFCLADFSAIRTLSPGCASVKTFLPISRAAGKHPAEFVWTSMIVSANIHEAKISPRILSPQKNSVCVCVCVCVFFGPLHVLNDRSSALVEETEL